MVTSDLRDEVEIWLFCACAMHLAIIIGTVRALCTFLWGRYHVPQNVFLVSISIFLSVVRHICPFELVYARFQLTSGKVFVGNGRW